MKRVLLAAIAILTASPFGSATATAQNPDDEKLLKNYSQWRLAQGPGGLATAATISAPSDFQVELVCVAAPEEGSWISLAFDPRNRLVVGREDQGLLRFTLADDHRSVRKVETINRDLLECRGLLFAHDALYVSANNSKSIHRLRDRDGDGVFEESKLLMNLDGGVGHGRNGLALGPDGKIYIALGNNVQVPKSGRIDPQSPYRNYGLDRLRPNGWNEFLFDADVVPPSGWVGRFDSEGERWELFAGGFRNPYGIAFNPSGELFVYDADMEWDVGAPWYRTTRVMHVVAGGEYGWRQGTNVWPDFFPDMLPGAIDIGLASPTGIEFATRSRFPAKYQDALFILDWAYGRIIAVFLDPQGATYRARSELFLQGKPLNVTDLEFGPDGAMYFTVGGRRTQSALYRVSAKNPTPPRTLPLPIQPDPAAAARSSRRELAESRPLEPAWRALGDDDPWIRFAARVALESRVALGWRERALRESDPKIALSALLSLARTSPDAKAVQRIGEWLKSPLTPDQRLIALRALQLSVIRCGQSLDADAINSVPAATASLLPILEHLAPASSYAENVLLCELLTHLRSSKAPAIGLSLLQKTKVQQERLFYLFVLRDAEQGWSPDLRSAYLDGLKTAETFTGAHDMPRFLNFIRADFLTTLTADERKTLEPRIQTLGRLGAESRNAPRQLGRGRFVKHWSSEELETALKQSRTPRDPQRGREMFTQAGCVLCHRRGDLGAPVGPDLDHVAGRLGARDLLISIVNPSRVVDEKYRVAVAEMEDGRVIAGQIVGGGPQHLAIAPSPLEPSRVERVNRSEVVRLASSPSSIMPEGLLDGLTQDEALDLLTFLGIGGD